MLSAEFGPGLDPARDTIVNDPLDLPADADDHSLAFLTGFDDAAVPASFSLDGLGAVLAANDDEAGVRREIVFVDDSVNDYAALIESLRRNNTDSEITVVVLDRNRDGIAQMDAVLAGAADIDAVHVISHGSDRGVQLGSTWLSDDTLATYAATISGWQDAFESDADFLFYGCNLAGSADGRALVDHIAGLTGTDVAASIDLTGSAALGGDWDLEYAAGVIETGIIIDADAREVYAGVLAQIAYEGFDYGAGLDLNGLSGGTGWTGGWSNAGSATMIVTTSSLADVDGLLATTGRAVEMDRFGIGLFAQSRELSTTLGNDGTTAWLGFLVEIDGTGFGEGISIEVGDPATGSSRVTIGYGDDRFFMTDNRGANTVEVPGIEALQGGTYFIAAKMEFAVGADTITMYVSPTPGLDSPDTTYSAVKTNTDLGQFTRVTMFGGQGFSDIDPVIDEIRIGDTYRDVSEGQYFLDRFDAVSFAGDDGTLSWTNDWQEIAEPGGAAGPVNGEVIVVSVLGEQVVQIADDGHGLWREADLTGAATAMLEFDYARINLDAVGDAVIVEVSTDGGGMWSELTRFEGPANDASYLSFSTDISEYIDNDTQIRFIASGLDDPDDRFALDNVRITVTATIPTGDFVVTNTNSGGVGSLEWAIDQANSTAGFDTITFNIAGAGPHVITVDADGLPQITERVYIDGWSEPDYAFDGAPVIRVIQGGSDVDGLHLASGSDGSIIRGLSLTGFVNNQAIDIRSDSNTIVGNYFGVATDGTTISANRTGIQMSQGAAGNLIGGIGTYEGNVIAGSTYAGIALTDNNTDDNVIIGNDIGLDATGAVVNLGSFGIVSWDRPDDNRIGGTLDGEGNRIAGFTKGIVLDSNPTATEDTAILGNLIWGNATIGIDLENDGVTENDSGDSDSGSNDRMNFPVLTNIEQNGADLDVEFSLDVPAGTYRIELFENPAGISASGYGEGQVYLGALSVVSAGIGPELFSGTLSGVTASAINTMAATATEDTGGGRYGPTSEFSLAFADGPAVRADLWLSTKQNVSSGGQSGTDDWDDADLITIGDPALNLGSGTTSGTFSVAFAGNGFAPGWDIDAAHIVSRNIQIGSSKFQLYAGDLLFSAVGSATLTSNNLVALDAGFSASLVLGGADLAVFRPDTAGDYSRGQFGLLIENLPNATVLSGVTLIEYTTVVGGYTLEAGDFLYARNGGSQDHSVWVYETDTTGSGSAPDQRREFLKGDDPGVGIANAIVGLELIEKPTLAGNALLGTGTLLLTIEGSENVGSNNLAVDVFDVFALDVDTSSLVGAGMASATMLFDGSDVAFNSVAEELNALALAHTMSGVGFDLIWVDQAAGKIQTADLDGSNVFDLLTGLTSPVSVAVDSLAGKVYWSDDALGSIQRANLDGSDVQTILSSLPGTVAIELDPVGGKIYWVEGGAGALMRANLDGSDIDNLVASVNVATGIALDVDNDKVYWADVGQGRIKQTSLTGAGTSNLVSSGIVGSADIAVDLDADQLYWSDDTTGEIKRVDFDGSDITTILSGLGTPYGLAIDSAAGKIYWTDDTTDQLHRANLDGSDIEPVVSGIVTPRDVDVVQTSEPANVLPTADASAGAPHTIGEGGTLNLDGSDSVDADGSISTYEWDIGNDGSFEKTGITTSFSWAELNAAGVIDDGTFDVVLRVTDNRGGQSTDTFTLTVMNTAPTFTVTGDATVVAGSVYSLDITATEFGDDTISAYTINWGDGTITNPAYTGTTTTVTHTYTDVGFLRSITFSAVDEDGTWTDSDLLVGNYQSGTDVIYRIDGNTGDPDGQFGSSGGALDRAYAPLFLPNGDYIVAGYDSDNIARYDSDGNYLGIFVASGDLDPGPATVQLDRPAGFAWGPDGNLYVSNFGDDEILRFDDAGNFIDVFGVAASVLNGPTGLAWSPDGDLYVSSWQNGLIVKFDGDVGGPAQLVVAANISSPEQLAFDAAGNLYIANPFLEEVQRWDGTNLTTYFDDPDLSFPTGLTFGPDGSLYVSSYSNDKIFRYDGATVTVFADDGPGGFDQPEHLLFTPAHIVFVNDEPVAVDDSYTIDQDTALDSTDEWWDTDWSNRRTISFDNAAQASALNGFPVLLKLNATRIDYDIARADGWDLRFVDTDGTLLAHEIEQWDPEGVSYVWVNIPQVDGASATDSVLMYYGNAGAAFVEDPELVWAGDYAAVYHLHDDFDDSTANNNDGSNSGSSDEPGRSANGQDFDGSNDSVEFSPSASINDVFAGGGTISAWIKPSGWGENGAGRILDKANGTNANVGWNLSLGAANSSILFEHGFNSNLGRWRGSLDAITLDEWQLVTVVFDSSSAANDPTIYVNGVALVLTEDITPSGVAASDAALDLAIGNRAPSSDRSFDGLIDEVRIVSGAQSADWVAAQYASGNGSFVTYGYEQSVAGVLGNDVDGLGDGLTAVLGTGPSNALAFTLNADGSFTYMPAVGWSGVDSFTYRANDGSDDSNLATVTITVNFTGSEPVFVSSGPFTIDENSSGGTIVGDIDANDGDGADPGLTDLIITEIMYDPDSAEDDWEWVEIYNGGSETVDLAGFVFDDNNINAVSAANIASGTIAAGETAILYNADDLSQADFIAAWGPGINLIGVSEWDDIELNNLGETIGLWSSFADYSGDHIAHANAFLDLAYDDMGPWPAPSDAASIFLTDLNADPTDGSNWALSSVGLASPHGGSGYLSNNANGNTGLDIGTPGDFNAGGGVTYSITANVNIDGDGQDAFAIDAATGVITVNDAGDLDFEDTTPLTITVQADDGLRQSTTDVTINLNDLNEQPAATNTTHTKTYTEGAGSVALDDIVVTDVDTGEMVTATLTLADTSAGVLTTSGSATYTVGTGVWTITDTVANVNTALAAVSFTPATNYDQDTTIAVSIADGGENGTVAVTGTITLDVTPVNDQLAATNTTQTKTYTEGTASVALDDIVVTDVDTGEIVTATLTLANPLAGSLTTTGGGSYISLTGIWTITDTVANVNTALAAVAFEPNATFDLDTVIAVAIADGGESGTVPVTGIITLDVTAVNNQAAATNTTQTQTYTEGAASVPLDDIVVTDADTNEMITATLTLADTSAGVLTTSGSATYTVGTGVWTITDTVANVNTALAAVSFTPATNYDQDTTIAVNIADGGENGTVAVTGTITLDVTPVNDQLAATNTTQTKTYTEGAGSVALDDIVVTDADTGEMVTATLTLADTSAGVLTTSGSATYTVGTGVWTITDTVANVNTALAAVSFTPATNYDQDTTIAVNIADGGENGTVAVTGTITLDVTPINDQLAATNTTQTKTYTEGDVSVAIDDIVVTDVDTNEMVTATLTLADTSAGVLTTSGSATYTVGTGVWTITESIANVNAALAAVSFTPATDYDQDTTIAVSIADGGENGTVAVTGTITLDVTPVNDQLAATNTTQTQVYNEGDPSVALDDIVVTDIDTGEMVTATLTLANSATGALTTSGSATYTAGTGVWTITESVANVNAALAAVSFTPVVTNTLDTTIAVSIADGGENGTVAVTGTITLDATPFNTQATATNTTQTIGYLEGAVTVALNDIVVTDPDAGEVITASLTLADPNAGVLTVSGAATYTAATGAWTITDSVANVNAALAAVSFTPGPTYDRDTTIAVSIADGGEFSTMPVTGTITLDVTGINEQPLATNLIQAGSYIEDNSGAFNDIVITDNDYLESVTALLTLGDPGAGALSTSGIATYDSGTGVWRAAGSVANVNAALAFVAFNPAANYDDNISVTVHISDGGENGATALNGSIALAAIPVGDTPVVANATTAVNTQSDPIVIDRNANDGVEVTHFRISGITNGRVTLADGTTPVAEGDYITVAAGQAGLRFVPDADSLAHGRFAVEASQNGLNVAAQSAKAIATITITGSLDDEPDDEIAGTAGAYVAENAATTGSPGPAGDTDDAVYDPSGSAPAESANDTDPNLLAAAAAAAESPTGASGGDEIAADDGLVAPFGSLDSDAARGEVFVANLRDSNDGAANRAGFVERFMFSAAAGLIRTDSYVDADVQLPESGGNGRAYDALLSDVEFLNELDLVREELNDVTALGQTFVGSSVALSTGISVGYVVWIARGGLLLASLVSSMPAWRLVDPLPILARLEDSDAAAGEGDSLASIIEQNDDGPMVVEHTVDAAPAAPRAH